VCCPFLRRRGPRCALRSSEHGTSSRWHINCAIDLPSHFDAISLGRLIRVRWKKVEWACARFLVRDGANVGWIVYMLKGRQKSAFGGLFDSVIVESFYNRVL
jgi:hypothetical protein